MNAILVIHPYQYQGTWVFDDPLTGLEKEPFVCGIPEIINKVVKDIKGAKKGFRLLFSAKPFPGHSLVLQWQRQENEGNWYLCKQYQVEGWLCPALFKYFKKAPKTIYAKAESV